MTAEARNRGRIAAPQPRSPAAPRLSSAAARSPWARTRCSRTTRPGSPRIASPAADRSPRRSRSSFASVPSAPMTQRARTESNARPVGIAVPGAVSAIATAGATPHRRLLRRVIGDDVAASRIRDPQLPVGIECEPHRRFQRERRFRRDHDVRRRTARRLKLRRDELNSRFTRLSDIHSAPSASNAMPRDDRSP